VVAVSSHPILRLFYWHTALNRIRKIKKPSWLQNSSSLPASPPRPGFWRRLERSIRKRRKRWIGGVGFEREWYLKEYPDIARAGIDPLDHYIQFGIQEGRWKSKRHKESNQKFSQKMIPWSFDRISFDSSWYLKQYPDVAAAGIDAYWHYKTQGFKEGRFKNRKENKALLGKAGTRQATGTFGALKSRNSPSSKVFIPSQALLGSRPVQTDIRAIVLYLPQYHAIPENDQWWGKGFTEWSNVRRGRPQYDGHYQPHIPHPDLGYYDLNDPSVMEKQAAIAKAAGIEGFCFYYYWFNGKRLLNMPTDRMLATGKPDFPFCFCWANENWTRTWDGGDNEILMAQKHSVENDEGFIWDLLPAFRDHRYIRVAGKPLLVVYRPSLLPNVRHTTNRWREICREEGIGEIHLAFMLGFECPEPTLIGFDTAIQMPPMRAPLPDLRKELKIEKPEIFKGEVRDYQGLQRCFNPIQISKSTWPAVCPSWDNTARRGERAHSWIHASPENYLTWLKEVVSFLRKDRPLGARIVFINAWNEWGEGCHLEPDKKYGYGWLNATRLALTDIKPSAVTAPLRVLVVGHDAARAGAQILLLTMLREWKKRDDVDFRVILLRDGPLRSDFQKTCPTMVLTDYPTEELRKEALQKFCDFSPDVILANTVVSGPILPTLKSLGVPIVSYIHELQKSIERWAPGIIMESLIANTDHFIAGAKAVATNLSKVHRVNPYDISNQESFIKTCKKVPLTNLNRIRKELDLRPSDKVVLGCGTMDWRKGPDIFARTAERVLKNVPDARFIWIGPSATDEFGRAAYAFAQEPRIRFIGEKENFFDYFLIGSAYFLSSREDPYPLVALEAADAGLPIVCFSEAGGIPDFVNNSCGRTVPPEDIEAAAQALTEILTDRDIQESLGEAARNSVRTKHDAVGSSEQVLSILKQVYCKKVKDPRECLENGSNPLVSVVVPNYNHAQFLPERITSIINQTNSNIEIIFLDDNSTDESIEIIETFVARDDRGRVLKNDVNSGSSFKQWRKGLREAKGKYVWIAESDDSADPELLQTLVARLEANDKAVLATCCPRMTSLEGNDLGIPKDWFADIGGKRWESDFSSTGKQMIAEILSKKNAILNASGVVFRNRLGLDELADSEMRLCGDWLFWVRLLARGDFEYVARPLNYWRIGSSNARTKPPGEIEWQEGKKVLREIAKILQFTDAKTNDLLDLFRERCREWQDKHKEKKTLNK
jgi:glycosyltransferase involved in cell wall biosynthesis